MTHNYAYAILATLTCTKMSMTSVEDLVVAALAFIAYVLLTGKGH